MCTFVSVFCRTRLVRSAVAAGIVASLAACSGTPEITQMSDECVFPTTGQDAPAWICPPHLDSMPDMTWAVGSFEPSKASFGFREKFAVHEAKLKLLEQVDSDLKELLKDYERRTGTADSETLDIVAESVSRVTREGNLTGVKVYRSIQDESGQLWVLAGIKNSDLAKTKEDILRSSYRDALAQHQIKAADKAMDEMIEAVRQDRPMGDLASAPEGTP